MDRDPATDMPADLVDLARYALSDPAARAAIVGEGRHQLAADGCAISLVSMRARSSNCVLSETYKTGPSAGQLAAASPGSVEDVAANSAASRLATPTASSNTPMPECVLA